LSCSGFFVYFAPVKYRPLHQAPVLIAAGVVALVCLIQLTSFDVFDRLERMSYDWRVRQASSHPPTVATNLGFVAIGDESIVALNNGSLGFRYGLYWPRQIYGRVLRELSAQGAQVVAFDVLFAERRFDQGEVSVAADQWPDLPAFLAKLHPGQSPPTYDEDRHTLTLVQSDEYFAWQLARSGVGVIAAKRGLLPNPLFVDQESMIGDIAAAPDADGVLRRARAFQDYRRWHSAFRQVEADKGYGVDLNNVAFGPGKIILKRAGLPDIPVSVDASNYFQLSDFSTNLPPGSPGRARAFEVQRVWHMGIVLAARGLGINLAAAEVDLPHGRITLRGTNGLERMLPVDADAYFFVNWEITPTNSNLTTEPIECLLKQDQLRSAGETNGLGNRGKTSSSSSARKPRAMT